MSECIHTDRLLLRPYEMADADAITALIGQWDVARWLPRVPHPYLAGDAEAFISRHLEDPDALAITHDGAFIGGCAIHDELGYWLGVPFWGQGFATEAATGLVDGHMARGHRELMSGHQLGNAASRHVLDKLGFLPTQIADVHSLSHGAEVKVQKMRLTAQDWQARS
ncbi:GNAT family N-acetyltransferase [Roseobacter sp. EG26]|uniref:GNAT family N-acetyltransferase n=1 Tax=Roseobacter sp. EG26 TaxID=3412477 RepID=UPI003CE59B83